MPASALSWKAIPPVTTSTMSGTGWLTALKSVFDSPNYIGGAARNPLTSWSTETLAIDGSLKLTAPNNPHGLIAHFAQNAHCINTPKSFGETNTVNGSGKVLGTIVLNPGTYASNTATPWGASARCFGYCHMTPMYIPNKQPDDAELNIAGLGMSNGGAGKTITSVTVRAWESVDAIVIHVTTNLGIGAIYVLGGWLAPDAIAGEAGDAETDGVLYGIITSGNCGSHISSSNSSFLLNSMDLNIFNSDATNELKGPAFTGNIYNQTPLGTKQLIAYPHCGVFLPGSMSTVPVNRMGGYLTYGTEVNSKSKGPVRFTTASQKFVKMPMLFQSHTHFMGRAREMWMFRRSLNGLALTSGGTSGQIKGYIVSFSDTVAGDAMILTV